MKSKKADMTQQVIAHIILAAMIFGIFLVALGGMTYSRDVKRQVIEKELALLIDSAEPGMQFSLTRENISGIIDNIEIKDNKIFATIDGLNSAKGHPFFSGYDVSIEQNEERFIIKIK